MPNESKRIRVLVSKPGLDGHDRGAKLIAAVLRDAGMEVIYTGLFQTPEAVVTTALQEDVDVVGASILSGSHIPLCREIIDRAKEKGLRNDIVFVCGGIIPDEDIPVLKELGVDGVYQTMTPIPDMVESIKNW